MLRRPGASTERRCAGRAAGLCSRVNALIVMLLGTASNGCSIERMFDLYPIGALLPRAFATSFEVVAVMSRAHQVPLTVSDGQGCGDTLEQMFDFV